MADRRMFAKTIIDSDAFLDMPLSTQALYFHLSMRADDEGFLNNPKKILRMIGASEDDLKILYSKNFIIRFETGIIVIKHWRIHNYIRTDRFKGTVYQEERSMLTVKENGSYTLELPTDNQVTTNCLPSDNQMETQVRLGKDSIGKDSLGEVSVVEVRTDQVSVDENTVAQIRLGNDITDAVATWNEMASRHNLPKVMKMEKGMPRYKNLKARFVDDKYTLEDFIQAIDNIEQSPWLLGQKSDWSITFDWLVLKTNFPKVLEGHYIRRNNTPQQEGRLDWIDGINYTDHN